MDSVSFCSCRDDLFIYTVSLFWFYSHTIFSNCFYNRTYFEKFVIFISWFVICSIVSNMDISSQLLKSLVITSEILAQRVSAAQYKLQSGNLIAYPSVYAFQGTAPSPCTSGDIFTLLLYTVQICLLCKGLCHVVGPE